MILLAVSGGIDSLYMANRARDLFPGNSFAVAHCNFHLRGDESDEDEAFVREWCASHRTEFMVKHFDTVGYAREHGISIEMAARELRYGWFANVCNERGYEAVAIAHNANDNAETLILNLLRGTGARGMRGMASESVRQTDYGELRILRPMLNLTREQIHLWMTRHGETWREDRTNAENDCRRNVIRNEIFPLFAEINPSFVRTLNRDMVHFSHVNDIAQDYIAQSGLSVENGLDLRKLLTLKHWEYVLFRLLEPCALSEETFGKLVELLQSDRTISGKTFQSPTHLVRIEKKTIYIENRK